MAAPFWPTAAWRSPWRCPRRWAAPAKATIPSSCSRSAISSCFGQAVLALAKKHEVDGQAAKVTCAVTIDKDEVSFGLKG